MAVSFRSVRGKFLLFSDEVIMLIRKISNAASEVDINEIVDAFCTLKFAFLVC